MKKGSIMRTGLLCLLLVAGCATRSEEKQVELSGKVFYRGEPLPGGMVSFVSSKGYSSGAILDDQGNYRTRVPVGDLKISVDNSMLHKRVIRDRDGRVVPEEPMKVPAGVTLPSREIKGKYVSIPQKYYSVDTSGLTYRATEAQTYDIRLE